MEWTFVYLMVFLKIPIAGLFWIVWWAVHNVDEEPVEGTGQDDDGGIGQAERPRGPKPRPARRGPHPGPGPAAPARTRSPRRSPARTGQDH